MGTERLASHPQPARPRAQVVPGPLGIPASWWCYKPACLPSRLPQLDPSRNYLNEWKKQSWREDVLLAQKSN